MITKREVGDIFRKLSKKYNFDYYSYCECCNTCFTANLPKNREYVYLKHFTKGMNYESSKDFNKLEFWYVAYGIKNWKKIFREFKQEAEKIEGVRVEVPKDTSKCLEIKR